MDPPYTFDGHFWVVRNDTIIDTITTRDKDWCTQVLEGAHIPFVEPFQYFYVEAPLIVQQIALKSLNTFGNQILENWRFKFGTVDNYQNQDLKCFQNALFEKEKHGGTIKFGSLGLAIAGRQIFVHGDSSWTTIHEFIIAGT
jgi:hypothetical protein